MYYSESKYSREKQIILSKVRNDHSNKSYFWREPTGKKKPKTYVKICQPDTKIRWNKNLVPFEAENC